jgi:serine/threonine-protein kinase
VRRSPSVIRISAQLVDGRDGTERWSQDYDRPGGDALQIQSDIANRVASALALQLTPTRTGHLTEGGTANAEAHDLYLQGLAVRQSPHASASLNRAISLVDGAIRLDPRYADAYALRATALAELSAGFSGSGAEMQGLLREAAASADRALALAPDLPMAHAALAAVASGRSDFARALAEFRRAAAGGQDAVILGDYSRFLAQVGFTDEAHRIGKQVVALDPLNGRSYAADGQAYYSARKYSDAVRAVQRLLTIAPGAVAPLVLLSYSLINLGRFDQARAVLTEMPADDVFRMTGEGILDEKLGDHARSGAVVENVEKEYGAAAAYQLAQLHAQRAEADLAFAALGEAIALPDPGLISLVVDPFLDPIRNDPRFGVVRRRIRFPPGLPS